MAHEPWLDAAVERLQSIVDDAIFAVGAQLWVSHAGTVVCDVAVGEGVGGPMASETVHNHYCMGKPFTAVALAHLVGDGRLDLATTLGDLGLPGWAVPPFPCTVLDVLDHQVGLDGMSGLEYRFIPLGVRADAVAERIAAAARRPAYSEVLGGTILEEVIAIAAPGESVAGVIDRLVLRPLGLDTIALCEAQARPLVDAGLMSVPIGGLPTSRIPLLNEVVQNVQDLRPAFGVISSARDLGRFFEFCRQAVDANAAESMLPREELAMLLSPRHPAFDDARTERKMCLAGGFMVDAPANQLARLASTNSFGHSGGPDTSVAFADVDHALALAIHLNGFEPGPPVGRLDRLAVVDEVYRCLTLR